MKKIINVLRTRDFGVVGIGAMIVFIAMVLVAGIAASVLVQTASKLEIQAMQTGEQTTVEVATGVRVVDIEGQYGERDARDWVSSSTWYNYSRIQNVTITIAPRAGSHDVDLQTTVVEISNSSTKCLLSYAGAAYYATSANNLGVFSTATVFDLGPYQFGVIELEDADGSSSASTPVLNRGDKVMLTINATACFWGLEQRQDVWGQIIPEEGAPGFFAFRTPPSFTDTVYDLW